MTTTKNTVICAYCGKDTEYTYDHILVHDTFCPHCHKIIDIMRDTIDIKRDTPFIFSPLKYTTFFPS